MSKPSDRKRHKQKARQRVDAKKKYQAEQKQLYAEKFPAFVYKTNGAPQEFVSLVQRTIKKIDLRDPQLFSASETKLFKLTKQYGSVAMRALVHGGNIVAQRDFICKLGELVFSLIPQQELRKWIPHHDVQIIPGGREILVSFRSLRHAQGPCGTIYYSRHMPMMTIDGQKRILAFSGHAIERICERIVPTWQTYAGLGDAFSFFDQCVHFERSDLPDGQVAFTFYDQCRRGFFSWKYVMEILGEHVEDDGHFYHRVGYCPAAIDGDFLKAKTLLLPGYKGTRENPLVWSSDVSVQLKIQATTTDASRIRDTEDFRLLKHFHQRGVPQVIHDKRAFFRSSV